MKYQVGDVLYSILADEKQIPRKVKEVEAKTGFYIFDDKTTRSGLAYVHERWLCRKEEYSEKKLHYNRQ